MDPITVTSLARAVERILVVGAGTLAVYCGYRLFSLFPAANADSSGRLQLPGIKVVFARVGPGLLFAALGVAILAVSLGSPISLKTGSGAEISSIVGQSTPSTTLVAQLSELSCIKQTVPIPLTRYPGDVDTAREALASAREALLLSNWQREWGDPATFRRWVKDPAVAGVKPVVQKIFGTPPSDACTEPR